MKKFKTFGLLFALMALLLVACVPEATPTAEPTEEPAATEEVAEEPTEVMTEEPEEEATEAPPEATEAATAEATAEASGDPILIGSIHPLTGGLAADGTAMDNAIQMAVEEINANGGVLGRPLEVLSADSTGSADVGQTEAERLIDEGVVALIGTYQSAVTANVAAVAEREQVPLIIDVAVADAILDQGYTYTFRVQPNATSMGENGAQFLVDMVGEQGGEVTSVVYLYEGTSGFGESVKNAFVAKAAELGIEVLEEISYDPFNVSDLTTEMTRVNSLQPDVLVVTGYYNDGLLAARNAEEVALDVDAVYGVAQGTYDVPQFVTDAGDLAQCFFDSNYHWDASNELALDVRDRYEEQFGEGMRAAAVLSYQDIYLLAAAIEEAGSADPAAIRDALSGISYADHILPQTGPIEFDETGENVNAQPVVMQVQDGTIYQVWPPDVAETEPVYPCVSWNE